MGPIESVPPDAMVAEDAIGRFLDHVRGGFDVVDAREHATVDAAFDYARRTAELSAPVPDDRRAAPADTARAAKPPTHAVTSDADEEVIVIDPRNTVPALPALRALSLADEAIGRFLQHRQAGVDVPAARERATSPVRREADPIAPKAADTSTTDLEIVQALADAPANARDTHRGVQDPPAEVPVQADRAPTVRHAEKTALLLRDGDVIVAPDRTEHTVIGRYQVDGISVAINTDTGLHLHKTWAEAKTHLYDVKPSPLPNDHADDTKPARGRGHEHNPEAELESAKPLADAPANARDTHRGVHNAGNSVRRARHAVSRLSQERAQDQQRVQDAERAAQLTRWHTGARDQGAATTTDPEASW